jgi:hypothetical protein
VLKIDRRSGGFGRRFRGALPCVALVGLLASAASVAAHWLPANDARVRHDVQLLVDGGVLPGALGTWPLPRQALAQVERQATPPDELNDQQAAAWRRLHRLLRDTRGWTGSADVHAVAGEAEPPAQLAWFGRANPQGSQVDVGGGYSDDRFAFRLNARWVEEPVDDQAFRADGSYAAVRLGNWIASAGAVSMWWGPGWAGSTILGNAARPVPGVALQRAEPNATDLPVLEWLGPWTFQTFIGQLESDRAIPRPYLVGARFAFQPIQRLEIGLSRTATWGGKGSPETLSSFWDMLIGDTNDPDSDTRVNQLAGYDFRLAFPEHRQPWAVYGQLIGEDEAGMLPSRFLGMAGLETWGGTRAGGSYRAFMEYSDTTVEFYESSPAFNVAYEHTSYRTGYRFRDRPLGYSTDNDSRLLTVGMMHATTADRDTTVLLRVGDLNRDDANRGGVEAGNRIAPRRVRLVDLEGEYGVPFMDGRVGLGAGVARLDEAGASGEEWEPRAWVSYGRWF